MIVKQVKGTSFAKLLEYLLNKAGAVKIAGTLDGQTPQHLTQEFSFISRLNRRVKRPVYHASFSLAPSEHLSDEEWSAIAKRYLEEMGFTQNQYVVVRHSDRDHDHIHVVAHRIRFDGSCVHDGWDYRRSEQVARQIERDYGLISPVSSWEKDQRSPSTGEWRLTDQTQQQSARSQIQQVIDAETQTNCTLAELIHRLQAHAIEVKIHWTRTGKSKGISYYWQNYHFSGTQLGRAYTFAGLQNYRGIDYLDDRTQFEQDKLLAEVKPNPESSQLRKVADSPIRLSQPEAAIVFPRLDEQPITPSVEKNSSNEIQLD